MNNHNMPIPNNAVTPASEKSIPQQRGSNGQPSKAHVYTPAPGSMGGDWQCAAHYGNDKAGHLISPGSFTDGSKKGGGSTKY